MAGAQTNFRARDMGGTRTATKTKAKPKPAPEPESDPDLEPVAEQESSSAPESEPEADGATTPSHEVFVPDGTVDEIMAWVGGDKSLAQAAKDKELANDHPRTTLLSRLDSLMDD